MTPLGLYLHIPFCEIKCGYCDFYSVTNGRGDARAEYVAALLEEIRAKGDGRPADTVFLGGGTPSLLDPAQVAVILNALRAAWVLAPDAEITLEANPETVTEEKLRGFREAGANRISFGVQSLDDAQLKALGRIHSADRARRAIEEARRAGFARINADLIFGLPGHTLDRWRRDLGEVLAWPVDHVSAYELSIEDDTAFGRRPPTLPGEEAVATMWEAAMDDAAAAGFAHYEVSNYARPGAECRHNLKYWLDTDWVGLGASAWGLAAGVRYGNPRSLAKYYAGRMTGFPPEKTDELPRDGQMAETLVLNLRLRAGCETAGFEARYGPGSLNRFAPVLAPHEEAGRVERHAGRLALTRAGLMVANSIWGDVYSAG